MIQQQQIKIKNRYRLSTFVFPIICLSILTGCAQQNKVSPHPIPPQMQQVAAEDVAAMGIGDEIAVDFRFWPELGRIQQKIRHDGYITLPHIGRAEAAGLTPEQLTARLTERYRQYLRSPELTVTVLGTASKKIYVGGEVLAPGMFDLTGNLSVLQAIMMAGGYAKKSAELSNVVVIRHQGKNRYVNFLDMEKAFRGEGEPFYLAAQDIVYVPRTKIDEVNQWIEQYMTKIITVTGFGVSLYPSDDYNIFIGGQ